MGDDLVHSSTNQRGRQQSRRQFLKTSAGLGLSAAELALLGACGSAAPLASTTSETLETTTIRLSQFASLCAVPQTLGVDFLKSEGFTDVQYVKMTASQIVNSLTTSEIDMSMHFFPTSMIQIDAGAPVTYLAGVHVGCFELFGTERVHTILDLKGKTLAISEFNGSDHAFVSTMAAFVGLDPAKDINWVILPPAEAKQRFVDGKLDALLAFPPLAQELRAKKIGQVIVNSMQDKPWSQYYCCFVVANRDFVQKNPIATKRALRSILKATDVCALQPDRAARFLVDKGFTDNFDYALEAMQDIPFNRWREYDPIDTMRFYALRLREAGLIKSSPDEIIGRVTDWRFLDEIKKERFASLEFIHQFQRTAKAGVCRIDV
jgi:NitT/TauT family transport system substrate-binding protein